ncbi:MAG TPA: clostripain-related cysteine peptidase, partial [Pyrinomonadaceae bacterium]
MSTKKQTRPPTNGCPKPPLKKAAPRHKWTVMIFLSGDNNLSEECVYALTEMMKAEMMKDGSNKEVAVVAQLDTGIVQDQRIFINNLIEKKKNGPGSLIAFVGPQRQERRRRLKAALAARKQAAARVAQQNGHAGKRVPGAKQSPPEKRPVGHFDVLLDFVTESVRAYPAEHYMLVLSGHGSGTVGDFLTKQEAKRVGTLSIPSLGGLLETIRVCVLDGKKLDILGMDSCLMSMIEVAYAVHNNVEVMIGAEGF